MTDPRGFDESYLRGYEDALRERDTALFGHQLRFAIRTIRNATRLRKGQAQIRGGDPVCVWQCEADARHRGWRDPFEPRGTCDYCLARTTWEQEVTPGEREHAPPRQPLRTSGE